MDTKQAATVAGASRVTGVPRSTIRSAIQRGELEVYEMGDGTVVVDLLELRTWEAKRTPDIASGAVVDDAQSDPVC